MENYHGPATVSDSNGKHSKSVTADLWGDGGSEQWGGFLYSTDGGHARSLTAGTYVILSIVSGKRTWYGRARVEQRRTTLLHLTGDGPAPFTAGRSEQRGDQPAMSEAR